MYLLCSTSRSLACSRTLTRTATTRVPAEGEPSAWSFPCTTERAFGQIKGSENSTSTSRMSTDVNEFSHPTNGVTSVKDYTNYVGESLCTAAYAQHSNLVPVSVSIEHGSSLVGQEIVGISQNRTKAPVNWATGAGDCVEEPLLRGRSMRTCRQ